MKVVRIFIFLTLALLLSLKSVSPAISRTLSQQSTNQENEAIFLPIIIDELSLPVELHEEKLVKSSSVNSIDLQEVSKLIASDGQPNDEFGRSVAIDGNTAIVGSMLSDIGSYSNQGAAYIFQKNASGTTWSQIAKLSSSDGYINDRLGYDVALDQDTAVVLAPWHDLSGAGNQGAAYVFERNAGGANNWGQTAKIVTSDGQPNDLFGAQISIKNDVLIIGADYADINGKMNQGAVYVFMRDTPTSSNWTEVVKLTASDGDVGDLFGWSVSHAEHRLLVGAKNANVNGVADQGAAYIFEFDTTVPSQWAQTAKLIAPDGATGNEFGWSVTLSRENAIVGAHYAHIGANNYQGAAYVFAASDVQGNASWQYSTKLVANDGASNDRFGISMSNYLDISVIGAMQANHSSASNQGAVYLYENSPSSLDANSSEAKLIASDGVSGDRFGWSTRISGNYSISGAYRADPNGNSNQGAAYVHDLSSLGINSIPGEVTLQEPFGTIANNSPEFVWQADQMATHYKLVVYDVINDEVIFTDTYTTSICGTTICEIQPENFSIAPGNYTWLVQAFNIIGFGNWSTYP